jgi:hypothetical protein
VGNRALPWALWQQPRWVQMHRRRSGPGRARGGRAPDGDGSLDKHRRVDGWVDGDHGLYRRRDTPSPDRYHGHRVIQAIIRDAGPSGGWPTLTKTPTTSSGPR